MTQNETRQEWRTTTVTTTDTHRALLFIYIHPDRPMRGRKARGREIPKLQDTPYVRAREFEQLQIATYHNQKVFNKSTSNYFFSISGSRVAADIALKVQGRVTDQVLLVEEIPMKVSLILVSQSFVIIFLAWTGVETSIGQGCNPSHPLNTFPLGPQWPDGRSRKLQLLSGGFPVAYSHRRLRARLMESLSLSELRLKPHRRPLRISIWRARS